MSVPADRAAREYEPSSPRKVLVVVGTRPEAIKLLPLIGALRRSRHLDPFVIATGQHPGVVEEVLALEDIAPDRNLHVARPDLTLNQLYAAVLLGLEQACVGQFGTSDTGPSVRNYDDYPTACVVHGDTSSAAAAAMAAFHLQIPVVHIEAGLRTGNTRSPYPEELNRQVISRIAAFHLAPTDHNQENLVREGIPLDRVFVTGNTGIDALRWAADRRSPYDDPLLDDLEHDEATRVVVVTAHRRENWGPGLERIGTAVKLLAEAYPDVRFVLPLHPNPRVAETMRERIVDQPNIAAVEPMEYTVFARLLDRAYLAITDSGGIQEEAPALGTPVLVVRETTERDEGVVAGTLKLVGTEVEDIVRAARELLDDPDAHADMVERRNPYGDGHASERIVAAFEHIAFAAPEPVAFGAGFDRLDVLRAGGFDEDPRAVQPMRDRLDMPDLHHHLIEDVDLA